MANWLQREALTTDEWVNTTNQIVEDEDVQDALSVYLVDQLYLSVDVSAQLQARLPPEAQKLSEPAAALVRPAAENVASRALASPRLQAVIEKANRKAHEQLLKLLDDKAKYVDANGEAVVLDLGQVVTDLAVRVGVDPATVEQVRSLAREQSEKLKAQLAALQTSVSSLDDNLAKFNGQELPAGTDTQLADAEAKTGALQAQVADLQKQLKGVEGKLPPALAQRATKLSTRLSQIEQQLSTLNSQLAAVKKKPTDENVSALRSSLAKLEGRVSQLEDKPLLNQPGQLVLIESSQLEGVQTATSFFRHLGVVLPLLVTIMYLLALYLAKGWRREGLMAIGAGIFVAMFVLFVVQRWLGHTVVDSLAASDASKSAVDSIWEIFTDGLRSRILFAMLTGLLLIGAGLLAGPSRAARRIRGWLAPALRDHVGWVYVVVAVLFLARLSLMASPTVGELLPQVVLAALAVLGVKVLRAQTAREFPNGRTAA